ncbi:MAG: S8 family serine peptidase, partial [Bdellovibrionales bacterium]
MKLSLVLLSSLLFVACQKEDYQFQDRLVGDGLLADRPVGAIKSQILLLELNEKPLLDGVSRAAGSAIQVDEERLASIKKEQNQFEAQLKSLNPEIKVLFRYQYLLNGFAILSPPELEKSIRDMAGVRSLKPRQIFNPPKIFTSKSEAVKKALDLSKTSVTHIEAPAAYEQGYRGQSLRVGVLDTGIDYTHAMFLGSGKKEDFTAVKPDQSTSAFPNKKVVGGIDLAGTDFDAASLNANKKIPKPDANPIDEEGHGTHVAGSIAGVGDGVNTYDGVAPEALLYAIKVFGSGSTSDEVVIAGLEW